MLSSQKTVSVAAMIGVLLSLTACADLPNYKAKAVRDAIEGEGLSIQLQQEAQDRFQGLPVMVNSPSLTFNVVTVDKNFLPGFSFSEAQTGYLWNHYFTQKALVEQFVSNTNLAMNAMEIPLTAQKQRYALDITVIKATFTAQFLKQGDLDKGYKQFMLGHLETAYRITRGLFADLTQNPHPARAGCLFFEERVQQFASEDLGFPFTHNAKVRIKPALDRIFFENPRAKAVDRADIGRFEITAKIMQISFAAFLHQTRLHLAGGFIGERDRENPTRREALFGYRAQKTLHQNTCFSRSRAGGNRKLFIEDLKCQGLSLRKLFLTQSRAHFHSSAYASRQGSKRHTGEKWQNAQDFDLTVISAFLKRATRFWIRFSVSVSNVSNSSCV